MEITRGRDRNEAGFTLVELLMAMAMISIIVGVTALLFTKSWELWKSAWTEMRVQQSARQVLERMAYEIRHARPGSVKIDSLTGEANYSRIRFRHVGTQRWTFYKQGYRLYSGRTSTTLGAGVDWTSTTTFMADGVEALQFMFTNFQDVSVLDVGVTISQTSYQGRLKRQQLTQRVSMRNP